MTKTKKILALLIEYEDQKQVRTERVIFPSHWVRNHKGNAIVVAFCGLRQAGRYFRADRLRVSFHRWVEPPLTVEVNGERRIVLFPPVETGALTPIYVREEESSRFIEKGWTTTPSLKKGRWAFPRKNAK